jgi:hypothetical protein
MVLLQGCALLTGGVSLARTCCGAGCGTGMIKADCDADMVLLWNRIHLATSVFLNTDICVEVGGILL